MCTRSVRLKASRRLHTINCEGLKANAENQNVQDVCRFSPSRAFFWWITAAFRSRSPGRQLPSLVDSVALRCRRCGAVGAFLFVRPFRCSVFLPPTRAQPLRRIAALPL